ncbi:MAG TPA: D-alanyl-D-alanine carboxypeptidase/D-alanyl-D-alanine-endopeptidase [Thermoanaerobaculia bacterium]|nr:D-alanyl-D-alanine carboxypeptidase/D-alanyl-D-alanine-endopeptidase [Thermoanaerobaculia bacterium]
MPGRKSLILLILSVLLVSLGPAPSASPQPGELVAPSSALELALQAEVGRTQHVSAELGVHIIELDSGETVYALHPDEPRVIASNSKLFTTAAALDAFGPGHFFETRFLLRGKVVNGVLEGDLGVVGGGDPHISGRDYNGDSYAPFRPWAQALRERGINRVTGDIYLAHGLFSPPDIHPDWPRDQLTRWYEAPVGALSFSDDCILVRVWPSPSGGRPRVELVPDVPVLRIENTARTIASRKGQQVIIARAGDTLVVRGAIGKNSGPVETWVTIPDPVRYFGEGLKAALGEGGVAVGGHLRSVDELPGAIWERVAVHRSDLVSIIQVTNKHSQNFYAETLAKDLGALRCGRGTWPDGVRAIGEFLRGIGVPPESFSMSDGSGMSRANRFAPRAVTTLLRHMFFHPAGREFAQSLPYSGEDLGSWKRRMAAPPYLGNVLAKTGTLDGVSALSGYAKAVSGKSYAFSILCNRNSGNARAAEDRIVMTLIDNG